MSDAGFSPSDNHWTMAHFRERVTKEQLQDLMLNHPDPLKHGRLREWKNRRVAPGVYEIWIGDRSEDT